VPSDAHARAARQQRGHRLRIDGWLPTLSSAALPVVVAALATPYTSAVFFEFLTADPSRYDSGLRGVTLRVALAVLGLASLDVHVATVRDEDRTLLSILPVDGGQVVRAQLRELLLQRAWLLPAIAAFFAPLSLAGHVAAHVVAVAVVMGAWLLGVVGAAAMYLLAVDVARSPRWRSVIEAIRGRVPPEQAPLIYAPGTLLGLASLFIVRAAGAVAPLSRGELWPGVLWLALPVVIAAGIFARLTPLARASWFEVTDLVADIDARYASLQGDEEGRRVYLDWLVRFLPANVRVWALKDLRHGWRARRGWISATWGGGLLAALAAWSGAPASLAQALAIGLIAVWGCGTVGVLMERDEPEFLKAWLPPGGAQRRFARGLVLMSWLQGAVWLPVFAAAIRKGGAQATPLLLTLELSTVVVALTVVALAQLRVNALTAYLPIAAVAGIAAMMVGAPS